MVLVMLLHFIGNGKQATFTSLLVGTQAYGACVLALFAKFIILRRRSTRAAHASNQDTGASSHFCNRVHNSL